MIPRTERMLWSVGAAGLIAAVAVIRTPVSAPSAAESVYRGATTVTSSDGSAMTRHVIAADVFRIDRRPSDVEYGTAVPDAPIVAAPSAPRPTLTLRGIAGPPYRALIEGMPGQEQISVVRAGDRIGALRISAISKDTVVIRGADTLWRLTLSPRWR